MRTALITAALLSLATFTTAWAENLPSIQQVYAAAKSGRLDQARSMVDTVLAAKPNSSKAHFVKAEICASQSDLGCVRSQLATAKRIDPGLGFANPAAVAKLEKIASGGSNAQPAKQAGHAGFPWGWLLIGLGIVALLWWIVSIANRRGSRNVYPAYEGGPLSPTVPGPGMSGMSPGYGTPMQGGGLGSTLGRGLATGAAIGAGMVAGEALADSLFHRNGQGTAPAWDPAGTGAAPDMTPDLGGADFGIGGDSWDNSGDLDSLGQGGDW
ncbi:MAG TPA: hypothetical protein VF811_07040 [Parasulfuritortus sp.]